MNLVALLLVVGLSWVAMMWLADKVHNRHASAEDWVITEVHPGDPCPECEGVGAKQRLGALDTCPMCEGTGIYTSIS